MNRKHVYGFLNSRNFTNNCPNAYFEKYKHMFLDFPMSNPFLYGKDQQFPNFNVKSQFKKINKSNLGDHLFSRGKETR